MTAMATLDYRLLLKKYIVHVGNSEGVDFISPSWYQPELFSKDEWDELILLSEEGQNESI